MSEDKNHQEASIETPLVKAKIIGDSLGTNTLMTFLGFVLLAGLCVWVFLHRGDAEQTRNMMLDAMAKTTQAIEKMTASHEKMIAAQRQTTCLLSLPEDKRQQEYFSPNSMCNRISQ